MCFFYLKKEINKDPNNYNFVSLTSIVYKMLKNNWERNFKVDGKRRMFIEAQYRLRSETSCLNSDF